MTHNQFYFYFIFLLLLISAHCAEQMYS